MVLEFGRAYLTDIDACDWPGILRFDIVHGTTNTGDVTVGHASPTARESSSPARCGRVGC